MHQVVKRVNRSLISVASLFLSQEKGRELERLRRGKEEYRRLQLADCVFVSFGKSGRTWLRVMLSRYYQLAYGLPERSILRFDNYSSINPAVPKIFFTHGNYLRDYTGHYETKQDFYDKRVILLVRRPQDVAVSQYFQWKYRMPARKKGLNQYPAHGEDLSLYDFVLDPRVGLQGIVDFMNGWADELPNLRDHLVLRYEDMHADPAGNLRRMVDLPGHAARRAAYRGGRAVRLGRQSARARAQAVLSRQRHPHAGEGPEQSRFVQGAPGQGRRLSRLFRGRPAGPDRRPGAVQPVAGIRLS